MGTPATWLVHVDWEADEIHEEDLPSRVWAVPRDVPREDTADWLTDKTGFLVKDWRYFGQ